MGNLTFVDVLDMNAAHYLSGVVDFEVFAASGRQVLYSASASGNGLSVFELGFGESATFLEERALPARLTLAQIDLSLVDLPGISALWVEPWQTTGTRVIDLESDGGINATLTLNGHGALGNGMVHATILDGQSGGGAWAYGGIWNSTGLVHLTLNSAGEIASASAVAGAETDRIVATTKANIGGTDFLFTVDLNSLGITAWSLDLAGNPTETDFIDASDGLGIATPKALQAVEVAGETYLVLASSGSSSLSVVAVDDGGQMSLSDHAIDSATTRFGAVQAMTSVTHAGKTYIIAGGGDDGLSLLQLLPGGHLLHVQSLVDSAQMTLNNVAALKAVSVGNEIQVFASSETEAGVTQFAIAPGPAGVVRQMVSSTSAGTSGDDILHGGRGNVRLNGFDGDDILIDGTGSDRLQGGAGADVFVLIPDMVTDWIRDFDPAEDRIDLSHHNFLRSVAQLEILETDKGAVLVYQGERLVIESADNSTLSAETFTTSNLLGLTHAMPMDGLIDALDILANNNANVIEGGAGDDRLSGRGGADVITGAGGIDQIYGGGGDDTLSGGDGDDLLIGGKGNDEIFGNMGEDRLDGGEGADVLWGGGGEDVLKGASGTDHLIGGTGDDRLDGGKGADHLEGRSGKDNLKGGVGNDVLDGGLGSDRLVGGPGADVFVFNAGKDRIVDFDPAHDLIRLEDSLWSGTLDAATVVDTYGSIHNGNTWLDFGDGNRLKIDDFTDLDLLSGLIETA